MAEPHFTLKTCPNCGAHEKAVGHWTAEGDAKWYCFNCKATGGVSVHVDTGSDPVQEPPAGVP